MSLTHDELLNHLAIYKRETLGVREDGLFTYRGETRPYPHILPAEQSRLNVMPLYREEFFASSYAKITFHPLFHHLNSSQALCINLFFPLIQERRLRLLTQWLGIAQSEDPVPKFEKPSDVENSLTKTNFDFHLRYNDGEQIYFEVKYTERDFGRAPNDKEHQDKYEDTYSPLLNTGSFLQEKCRDRDFFLRNYQLLRNLVHLGPKAHVVFLIPKFNRTVSTQALRAIEDFVTLEGRSRVRVVFLEDFVSFLERNADTGRLREHLQELRRKYFPATVR